MGPDGGRVALRAQVVSLARLVFLMSTALILGACASSGDEREATGIVVDVQGELEEIESFTVLVDGEPINFETSPEGDYGFPLGHLRDHLRSGEPVRVRWREEGGRLVAEFLDDA